MAQAGKLSADLQQRIPAATEAVNQLRFPSAGLLTKLLWSVAPFLLIGLALLFWRSGSAPGPPPGSRATTVALGIVWWFAAFPFVAYCMGAIHASESFSIVAMMIALAFVAMIARRKTDQWHSAGDAERGSRWLRAFSWLGWLLAAVAVALALFCLYSLMSETGPWNPAPSEGALATLDFLGVALLPWAATHLRKVARWEADPNHPTPMPSVRAPFQYAAFMLLIPLLTIGCFFAVYLFSRSAQPSGVTHFICIPVGVSNNVVIVDVTTVVRRGNAELRPLLEGPRLPAATEASFQDAFTPPFSGTFIKPTPYSGNQVFRLLPTRRQTSRLGFVLPTAALAQDAFDNLRSIGPLPAEPGRTFAGTLFEVSQPNGATYRASMQVAPPFTSADPNWVSVSGQNQHAESAVTLTWKVLASRPGMAHLARADSLIKILQSDQETKLYGVSVQFELSKVGADRVLFVRRIGGATVSEGFVGNFRDLADELLRTKTVSATTVRGANVELCQFQGKSITVRVDGALPSPPTTQLRVWSFSLAAIVVGAAVLLIAAGGIALLLVLARKGGAAGKTALRVIGVMLLLFGVSVFTLIGLRGSNARQAQVKAELAERALMKNALAADDAAPTHASVATQDPTFGPVIERIINHPGESTNNYFLDLDSGNFMDAPGNVFSLLRVRFDGVTRSGRTDDPIKSWAQTSGADLTLGMTSPEITIVLYGGLISFPTLSFAKADAQEVLKMSTEAAQRYKTNGTPLPPLTMFNRPGFDGDGAVLFQTREGGVGILQIVTSLKSVGSTENPRSVRIRYKLVVAGPGESTRGISLTSMTRPFPLRHKLGSDMAEQLRAILLGRRNSEAAPSADNQEVLVTAPPDVMTRVQTFIIATDWPDKIERGPNYEYPRQTVMRAARSFFYACAIEDAEEAISKLLSPRVLAELKGEAKSRPYKDYYTGGVPDAHWEALLRADWPGKKEALQHLIREWNRYPLKRITEDPGIALGFGVKHFCSVSFEGAPNDFYQITIEPGRTEQGTSQDSFFFSSLPPWWNVNSAYRAAPTTRIVTKPGTYDIKPGLKLVIADGNDEKKSATKRSVAAELIWQAEGETQPSATYGVPLSNGLPYGVAWQEDGKALWISCGAQLGSGVHKHIDRYLRILAIRSPGDVEERTIPTGQPDADAADQETYHAVPEDIRRSFEALDK
ncbi:MAG: hypothetical protein HYR88_02750 [Verrucomicrobia bacterium]|nr:hypothetical protein [Verrucomicrobiota bacterium]